MPNVYNVKKYSEGKPVTWGVYSPDGDLVCVCLYKRGAIACREHLNSMLFRLREVTFDLMRTREKNKALAARGEVANG